MKKTYFTVGPSQLYPTIKKHITSALTQDIPSANHRGEKFQEIYTHTHAMLRKLLNIPDTHHIFFLSSAHESMERVLRSTVDKHSFHFITGAFSRIFYNYAKDYGKHPEKAEDLQGKGFDMQSIQIPEETELICITQNETSTGISIPMDDIYVLKKRYPKMLIAIDIVSSAPYVSIDFSQIDITFFSVQKGLGLPAGLAVLIINDAALKKAQLLGEKIGSRGGHHGIITLHADTLRKQTTETPNVMNIYLLGKVAEDMITKGVENIRKETEKKANLIYTFFDNHPIYKPLIKGRYRSKTTIVIDTKGQTEELLRKAEKQGIIIGPGYGDLAKKQMRISNFPAHTLGQVKQLLELLKDSHK
jgi:phosphoserine aminotransferase